MSVFVEKEFYHEPPTPDASPEVWEKWLAREKKSRAAHKAQHTKAQEVDPEAYESMFHSEGFAVKVNGVYKQQDSFVGFGGSKEDGTLTIEPGVKEDQEHRINLAQMEVLRHRKGTDPQSKGKVKKNKRKAKRLQARRLASMLNRE